MAKASFPVLLAELALRLYAWPGREILGATDVLVWTKGAKSVGVAFRGDALRMQLRFDGRPFNNHQHWLDLSLQKALGFEARYEKRGSFVMPERQTMDDDEAFIGSVLEGVEQLSRDFLGGDEEDINVDATLMPEQGSPWWPGDGGTTTWFSAKKKKVYETSTPDWLVQVKDREGKDRIGADFCKIAERIDGFGPGHVMADLDGVFAVVTHCLSLDMRIESAKAVKSCGGLLFPSLAVSLVPSTNFGHLVLVAHPMVALQGVKPYRGRGRWPVTVYGTDAWTGTTTGFIGDASVELFDELTGNTFETNWIYNKRFWVLGDPVREQSGMLGHPVSLAKSTKEVRSKIASRFKKYRRELNEAQLASLRESSDPYPLLEAKANLVVGPECFNLALCERKDAPTARAWLDAAGFEKLKLIAIDAPEPSEGRNEDWDYAWTVRDVLLEYASADVGRRVFSVSM